MQHNVYFRNFWESNDNTKLFLKDLFQNIKVTRKDIYISSVFIKKSLLTKVFNHFKNTRTIKFSMSYYQRVFYNLDKPLRKKNTLNIWFTGENLRPPSNQDWDLLLTFETDQYFINELYLPFWATNLGTSVKEAKQIQKKLLQNRNVPKQNRKFACIIMGNPHPKRIQVMNEIRKIGEVDGYGFAFNKKINDKETILANYDFNICFENDLYPGYVTEKLFDSWNSYCIPIWWGIDPLGYVNQDAIIDFARLGMANGIKRLQYLKSHPLEIRKMKSLPILSREFDYDKLIKRVSDVLTSK